MFSGVCSLLAFVSVKETYAPVILARKARRMRKQKNDQRYVAPLELNRVAPRDFAKKTLMRPFTMLLQEPMLLAITLYTRYVALVPFDDLPPFSLRLEDADPNVW